MSAQGGARPEHDRSGDGRASTAVLIKGGRAAALPDRDRALDDIHDAGIERTYVLLKGSLSSYGF
jgi:hypothetical protein